MMNILELLEQLKIDYQLQTHAAVYTCEQADNIKIDLTGAHTKNLFLRDRKGRKHFLVCLPADKRIDLKQISQTLEQGALSMASPERLLKYLGIKPGSVSLLAVVNDKEKAVEVVIEESIWQQGEILCHPLVNTATLSITTKNLQQLYQHTGHKFTIMSLPLLN